MTSFVSRSASCTGRRATGCEMSIFPTKILLTTDGSSEAELASQIAVELAQMCDSELHVVYVADLDYHPSADGIREGFAVVWSDEDVPVLGPHACTPSLAPMTGHSPFASGAYGVIRSLPYSAVHKGWPLCTTSHQQ